MGQCRERRQRQEEDRRLVKRRPSFSLDPKARVSTGVVLRGAHQSLVLPTCYARVKYAYRVDRADSRSGEQACLCACDSSIGPLVRWIAWTY